MDDDFLIRTMEAIEKLDTEVSILSKTSDHELADLERFLQGLSQPLEGVSGRYDGGSLVFIAKQLHLKGGLYDTSRPWREAEAEDRLRAVSGIDSMLLAVKNRLEFQRSQLLTVPWEKKEANHD